MKKSFCITLLLLLLVPSLVYGAEEKTAYQVSLPYFDIWKYTNGTWQDTNNDSIPDALGQSGKTFDLTYTLDSSYLEDFEVKDIEISTDLTEKKYNEAGKYFKYEWFTFNETYFGHRPSPYTAEIDSKDLENGKAIAKFTLTLGTEDVAIDRKTNRFSGDNNAAIDAAAEGWRWYLPAIVTWHLTPKAAPEIPDLYTKSITTTATKVEGGKQYNATVTYGMKGPYEGVAPCKIGLTHNGHSVSDIDGQKLNLSQWEEKTFEFTFTGQKGKDSVLEAKIWPDAGDRDWDNNSKKLVIPQKVEFDLEAYLESVSEVESGTTEKFGGWLYNKSDVSVISKGVWRVNGKVVKTFSNVTIPANEGIRTTYDFSIPAGTATGKTYQVEIEVNPDRNQPSVEKTWSNNKSSDTIEAYLGKSGGGGLKGDTIID